MSLNTVKVKICGIRREEDIDMVNAAKPDLIGFVFVPGRKRYISFDEAAKLRKRLDNEIKAVGVFIDEDVNEVARLLNEGIIDIAQLHGNENEEYIKRLRELCDNRPGKTVIKAIRVKTESDVKTAEECSADMVLLDSGTGSGETFDWDLTKKVKRPYFLAGGLNPENISEAISKLHPYGVDISSGVETDGYKDGEKIGKFMKAVRNSERYTGRTEEEK